MPSNESRPTISPRASSGSTAKQAQPPSFGCESTTGLLLARRPAVQAVVGLDAQRRGQRIDRGRRAAQRQRAELGVDEEHVRDAAREIGGDRAAHLREPAVQRLGLRQHVAHQALRAQPLRVAHQPVVLVGARDDLRVDRGEPGDELEVLVRERAAAQAVRQVQDAEHAVAVDQRRRDRRLDVAALAGDRRSCAGPPCPTAGWACGPRTRGPRCPRPGGSRIFGMTSFSMPERHLDPQRAGVGVPEQERAAVGAGRADGDLQDPVQQPAPVDGQVVRLEDLAERLQQVGLARRVDRARTRRGASRSAAS